MERETRLPADAADISVERFFAPFLHYFCTMKLISKLYLATLGKVSSTPQPIVRELVASERGLENLFFGKRKGKILVSFMAPLTSNLAQTSKEEVVLVLHQRLVLPGGH